MSSRVELWVDPCGSSGFGFFDHTTICVVFENNFKYLFSYNQQGLSSYPAPDDEQPRKLHHLGETNKTLPEITKYAQHLADTDFKEYSVVGKNCNRFSNALSEWLCGESIPPEYQYQDAQAIGAIVNTSDLFLQRWFRNTE